MYVTVEQGDKVQEKMKHNGAWVGLYFDTSIIWPDKDTLVVFENKEIFLLIETENELPGIVVLNNFGSSEEAYALLRRFLGALAWIKGGGTSNEHGIIGSKIVRVEKRALQSTTSLDYNLHYLPEKLCEKARLSLGLYREGHSLNHAPYQFLSFYKIINLHYKKSERQKKWISRNLSKVDRPYSMQRYEELKLAFGEDINIANYLYGSGRCAVAHAGTDPMIDPDNPEDFNRLYKDLPLIDDLATLLIREKYSLFTEREIYDLMPFSLEGFVELIDENQLATLKNKGMVPRRALKIPKFLSLKMWNQEQFESLNDMSSYVKSTFGGIVNIRVRNKSEFIEINFFLDYPNNKLIFDPLVDVQFNDDMSKKAVLEMIELEKFKFKSFCNGQLEVWDNKNQKCMASNLGYMPLNCFPVLEDYEALIKNLLKEVDRRE